MRLKLGLRLRLGSNHCQHVEAIAHCHRHFVAHRENFRVQYKQKHPNNKSVAAVGKAGSEKWKSMSDAEKASFIQKAEKRKSDYEKSMNSYNKRQAEGNKHEEEDEEESDKSRSEVNDEDDDDNDDGSGEVMPFHFKISLLGYVACDFFGCELIYLNWVE